MNLHTPTAIAPGVVSAARPEDAFAILETLTNAITEIDPDHTRYPLPEVPYCVQAMLDLIAQGLVVVVHSPTTGRIVGCLALDFARWPWVAPGTANKQAFHLYNQHFWVEPRYRRGGVAQKLLDAAKGIADERGLSLVFHMTSGTDAHTIRLHDRFMRSRGFEHTGGSFIRVPSRRTP